MTKYTKKPVEIEAVQLFPNASSILQVERFIAGKDDIGHASCRMAEDRFDEYCNSLIKKGGRMIKTLEGEHFASFGDFIIKGVKGEFYPCKPDIFEMTYLEHTELRQSGNINIDEKILLHLFDKMCIESLSPETFEMWKKVKYELKLSRPLLKD